MPARPLNTSTRSIVRFSLLVSFFVYLVSIVLQWFIYDDWLHHTGPIRIIGSAIAAFLTFAFVFRRQLDEREERRRMQARFDEIARMNDRIRNALQAIECVTYVQNPNATKVVQESVERIETVLRDVVANESSRTNHSRKNSAKRGAAA